MKTMHFLNLRITCRLLAILLRAFRQRFEGVIKNGQSRDSQQWIHTQDQDKLSKQQNTETKKMSNTHTTKQVVNPCTREG
jgi:hypothetical protein